MRLFLTFLVSAWGDSMLWHDPDSGASFDWSSLRSSEPYIVLSPSSDDVLTTEYIFTLGTSLENSCSK